MATPKEPIIRRLSEGGPLQDLLLKICPPNNEGVKSITVLADKMGISSQAIYRWIENKRVPSAKVKTLVKLAGGRVTLEEIVPYVIG